MVNNNTESENAIELKKDKETFLKKLREKLSETGINAKIDILQVIANSTHLMASVVGNEIVIATFMPMIPSLIFDEVKRRVFNTEISDLGNKINKVKDIINPEILESPKGRKLFQNTMQEILEQTDKEKIDSLKALFVNSLINTDVDVENKEILLNILRNLTVRHIKFLKMFYDPPKYVESNQIKITQDSSAPISALLGELFPEYTLDIIMLTISDLHNMGLTHLEPNVLITPQNSYGLHLVQNKLLPLGRSLVNFIISK